MNIKNLFDFTGKFGISGLFSLRSSVGSIDGETVCFEEKAGVVCAKTEKEKFILKSDIIRNKSVYIRNDAFTNKTDENIYIYKCQSRFAVVSDNIECYTQSNMWTSESHGEWQKLSTGITASSCGVRSTAGASPFLSVWDENAMRGIAFNIVPNTAWQYTITKKPYEGEDVICVIECGICSDGLDFCVKPHETINFPQIIFYDFENKTDMGCYKLHEYINRAYPCKKLPVMYNSWFANFDEFDMNFMKAQADAANKLGIEYFTVDAGWFGNGKSWVDEIGEWEESADTGFCGQMTEFADYVRGLGMNFGLWIEAERALANTKIAKEHPEYFIKHGDNFFLDYADENAFNYITDAVVSLIEKYGIKLIKFDFNADCPLDSKKSAFYRYHEGHKRFIGKIREKYPDIYIENCASGGARLDLFHLSYMDSVWFSDNQNPQSGIKILRETFLRLAPWYAERWAVLKNADGFSKVYSEGRRSERLFTVKGATWQTAETVSLKFIKQFLTGGAMGFSCDLTSLSEETLRELKAYISEFKKNREFFRNCVCIPLVSNDTLTVLQYSDSEEKTVVIEIFYENTHQSRLTVYPKLKNGRNYAPYTAAEINENGITVKLSAVDKCAQIILSENA